MGILFGSVLHFTTVLRDHQVLPRLAISPIPVTKMTHPLTGLRQVRERCYDLHGRVAAMKFSSPGPQSLRCRDECRLVAGTQRRHAAGLRQEADQARLIAAHVICCARASMPHLHDSDRARRKMVRRKPIAAGSRRSGEWSAVAPTVSNSIVRTARTFKKLTRHYAYPRILIGDWHM